MATLYQAVLVILVLFLIASYAKLMMFAAIAFQLILFIVDHVIRVQSQTANYVKQTMYAVFV